jgi:hypothetical protein
VVEITRNDVAEAEIKRHHNHSTKDRTALEAILNEGVINTSLRATKST